MRAVKKESHQLPDEVNRTNTFLQSKNVKVD